MVKINRSNIGSRRVRSPRSNSLVSKLQDIANDIPALSQLSPIDRLLVLVGVSLVAVVSFAYFFLISGIFSGSGGGLLGGSSVDPRLSYELRKTGLSEEALMKRGGGRRISIGPQHDHALDSNENAVALDIIATLNCDALQEELEREWHTKLDEMKNEQKSWGGNSNEWNSNGGGGAINTDWDKYEKEDAGKADDFAGELAAEEKDSAFGRQVGGDTQSGDGSEPLPDGNESLDDFVNRRRRLSDEEAFPDEANGWMDDIPNDDGVGNYDSSYNNNHGLKLTARHLFCLAAEALTLPKSTSESIPDPSTHCDVNSFEIRDRLLYLWSSARSQMKEEVILKTLKLVTEHKEDLRGHEVHVWYPENDRGTEGMLNVLNSGYNGKQTYNFDTEPAEDGHDNMYRFHDLPDKFVGENKLFVDVGSALGLTSMLITYLYPETTIVSIEPASPSWLIQNINFRCNLSHNQLQYVHPILAGVGTKHHDDNDSMMKMIWKTSLTTATRSWNPEEDFDFGNDIELVVHLRTLRAILAEATPEDLPLGTPISVLNLDCEGCEYNLIPSMHETSFNSIGIILGRTNWGYIPTIKKPSSHRARETHERVCTHYNFALRCKECCDFPSLSVKHRITDDLNDSPTDKSVAEVAGELCNGFEEWATASKLRDIPDDYGWNEMSAFASAVRRRLGEVR